MTHQLPICYAARILDEAMQGGLKDVLDRDPSFYVKLPGTVQDSYDDILGAHTECDGTVVELIAREIKPGDMQKAQDRLRRILGPDIHLHVEDEFSEEAYKHQKITIQQSDLQTALEHSEDPVIKQGVQRYAYFEQAKSHHADNPSYSVKSYMGALATGAHIEHGPFIKTGKLRELVKKDAGELLNEMMQMNTAYDTLVNNPEIMEAVIRSLKKLGVSRVAFLNSGSESMALLSAPDTHGKQQIIMLSPYKEAYSGHPVILPALHHEVIMSPVNWDKGIRLRIMPEVRTLSANYSAAEKTHIKTLIELLGKSHAHYGDIDYHNVGIYDYKDANGVEHSVPMIFDWGIGRAAERAVGGRPIEDIWETMPELAPWRAAQDHIKSLKVENVFTADDRKKHIQWERDNGAKLGAITRLSRKHYRHEIGDMAERVTADIVAGRAGDKSFSELLLEESRKRDLSDVNVPKR